MESFKNSKKEAGVENRKKETGIENSKKGAGIENSKKGTDIENSKKGTGMEKENSKKGTSVENAKIEITGKKETKTYSSPNLDSPWNLSDFDLMMKLEEYKLIKGMNPIENANMWMRFSEVVYDGLSPSHFSVCLKKQLLGMRNKLLMEEKMTDMCRRKLWGRKSTNEPPITFKPWDLTGPDLFRKMEQYQFMTGVYPLDNDMVWIEFSKFVYYEMTPVFFSLSLKERIK